MQRDERHRELEAIRASPDGLHQLAGLYGIDLGLVRGQSLPDFMVDALVERILEREFPEPDN